MNNLTRVLSRDFTSADGSTPGSLTMDVDEATGRINLSLRAGAAAIAISLEGTNGLAPRPVIKMDGPASDQERKAAARAFLKALAAANREATEARRAAKERLQEKWLPTAQYAVTWKGGNKAWMRLSRNGQYKVLAGSSFATKEAPSLHHNGRKMRKGLLDTGVVSECGDGRMVFLKDHFFRSLGLMTQTVSGGTASGAVMWRNRRGDPLGKGFKKGRKKTNHQGEE